MRLIQSFGARESAARVEPPDRGLFRIAAVQTSWHADPDEHRAALAEGVRLAAHAGAQIVCLQELTLSPYFAIVPGGPDALGIRPEILPAGPTHLLAADLASRHDIVVHASLYEAPGRLDPPGLGFTTAIAVDCDGTILARTRKIHLPPTSVSVEGCYSRGGDTGYPVIEVAGAMVGLPTGWDQWFPEGARAYSLGGADIVVYSTAIGSEPDHPGFDTQPMWQQVIVGNGIANGLTMVAVNRIGTENLGGTQMTFYGSSFISDPYGHILCQADRDEEAVLVADIDLDARRDWLTLFPLLGTRRPDTYDQLTA